MTNKCQGSRRQTRRKSGKRRRSKRQRAVAVRVPVTDQICRERTGGVAHGHVPEYGQDAPQGGSHDESFNNLISLVASTFLLFHLLSHIKTHAQTGNA